MLVPVYAYDLGPLGKGQAAPLSGHNAAGRTLLAEKIEADPSRLMILQNAK